MAPIEVKTQAPDTLPEDFAGWDGAAATEEPVTAPPKKAPPVERPRPTEVRTTARAAQRTADARIEEMLESRIKAKKEKEAEAEEEEESSGGSKKGVIIAVVAVVVLAGAGAVYMLRSSGSHPAANQPAVTVANTAGAPAGQSQSDVKPDAGKTVPGNTATTNNSAASIQQQAAETSGSASTQQQSTPVTINQAQFNGASRIPKGQQQAGSAPSLGNLDMSGGGAGGGISLSSSNYNVKYTPNAPIEVSQGVLQQMLISKTTPEYPAFAKSARISGTVTVSAIITKQGQVTNAHAVSGPQLLRQSAVDAVKTWRYRPCLLNNQPVEVKAMINVNFVLQ
jgi:TonB family protein